MCHRGDSFELELTLKDSGGIPINLWGAGGESTFEMTISNPMLGGNLPPGTLAGTTNTYESQGSTATITVTKADDQNSTTADTASANYVLETAATGVVKFSMSQTTMKLLMIEQYGNDFNYIYDIKYVNPNILVDGESEGRTILFGNFTMKGDFARSA